MRNKLVNGNVLTQNIGVARGVNRDVSALQFFEIDLGMKVFLNVRSSTKFVKQF